MNASCTGCHDLRPIQTAAKDSAEWAMTIDAMIGNGAEVKDADKAPLVEYLTANHPPMPEGRGKNIVMNICTMCHDTKRIRLGRRSPEEWEETLNSMLNEGAPLSDEDFPVVLAYLSRNFNH
jgi:cytochrome c5